MQEAGAHEGRPHYDFISLSKELLPPGSLFDTRTIPFNFRGVEKIHEVSLFIICSHPCPSFHTQGFYVLQMLSVSVISWPQRLS